MSNWGIEDDTNLGGNNDNLPGPKALRDAYEAMKKQNETLQSGLQSIQKELQTQKVASTLSELGIPATAAQQYTGEADPEKVREWATTMQTIFGGGSGTPNTPTPTDQQTLDPNVAQQMQRFNEAGQQGTPLGNAEMAAGKIGDATDIQGLISAWQNLK
jgi:hypothetical protein